MSDVSAISNFRVGDVVVRVGRSWPEARKGAYARVIAVGTAPNGDPALWLTVRPLNTPNQVYDGWHPRGWQKVQPPRNAVTRMICAARPQMVPA